MRKNYTAEEKQAVIDRYRSGVAIADIAKETGVARNTIYTWIEEDGKSKKKSEKVNMRDYATLTLCFHQFHFQVGFPYTILLPVYVAFNFLPLHISVKCVTVNFRRICRKRNSCQRQRAALRENG